MKLSATIITCCLVLSLLSGCQEGVRVVVLDGSAFPQDLVGRWKADKHGWEFVFEPDGKISSAVIAMGRIELKPGRKNVVPMKLGKESVFEPGVWMVQYSPKGRELIVEINVKSFQVVMGSNIVEGSSKDIIAGQITDEGLWEADWVSYPKYIARTPEHPEFVLTDPSKDEPEASDRGKLVFTKIGE